MNDTFIENMTQIIISAISGGGLVALITALKDRKKNKTDITTTNIETAIRLKDEAVKEYQTAEAKLARARELLDEVQDELNHAKSYIDVLQDILRENDIPFPEFDAHKKGAEDGEPHSTSTQN